LAQADEVIFKSGDRLTGTITSVDSGKLKIKSAVAGEVTVDLKDVQTFTTDETVQMRLKDKSMLRDKVRSAGEIPTPTTAPADIVVSGRTHSVEEIKRINAKQEWTGSVVANVSLARGNTHSLDVGVDADATLRRDDEWHDDRFTLSGGYNFSR